MAIVLDLEYAIATFISLFPKFEQKKPVFWLTLPNSDSFRRRSIQSAMTWDDNKQKFPSENDIKKLEEKLEKFHFTNVVKADEGRIH